MVKLDIKNRGVLSLLLSVFLACLMVIILPQITQADPPKKDPYREGEKLIKQYIYYDLMRTCLAEDKIGVISSDKNLKSGDWFNGSASPITGLYFDPVNGGDTVSVPNTYCNTDGWVREAAKQWGVGLGDVDQWIGLELKDQWWLIGKHYERDESAAGKRASVELFEKKFKENVAGKEAFGRLNSMAEYLFWARTFKNHLDLDISKPPDQDGTGERKIEMYHVDPETCDITKGKYYQYSKSVAMAFDTSWPFIYGDIATKMINEWDTMEKSTIDPTLNDAIARFNKNAEEYNQECLAGLEAEEPLEPGTTEPFHPEEEEEQAEPSCEVQSVGWIICPVVRFLSNIADKAYGFIEKDFLTLEDSLLNDEDGNTKAAWQSIVGLANIVFIIFFLIIIFSQLTSVGISNYGIKKMLPKLIVAAILVNLSFLICQIAVDISNIVGQSVNEYVRNAVPTSLSPDSIMPSTKGSATGEGFAGIAGFVLIASISIMFLSLSVLIPMLVGVVISCIMILFILVGRKALVVILAVISPLAFVAYLLPNTKKFFDMWKKAFISILLVYPIVGLVFAGSKLASNVLMPAARNNDSIIMEIIASSVAVLPLFVVPGLLKKSLDGVAGLGSMVGKLDKGASGLGKSGVAGIQKKYAESDFGKYRATRKADIKARTKAGNYNGKNLLRKGLSKTYGAANSNRILNAATGGLGANRDKLMNKQDKDDAKEFTEMAGDNEDIINAIANDGFNEDSAAFKGLSKENQKTIRKMKALELDRKASTYLGTAQYMAENGMGTGADVDRLLQTAKSNGAKENTVENAYGAAVSNLKKSGHAINLADLSNAWDRRARAAYIANGGTNEEYEKADLSKKMTDEQAFAKINPIDINKYSLSGPNEKRGQTAYKNMLANKENRNILASTINNANNIKNPEAQKLASKAIIEATGKVVANNEKRFADIQAVQNHVKEHGFSEQLDEHFNGGEGI